MAQDTVASTKRLLLLKGLNHISTHIFIEFRALNFFLTIHDLIGLATKCQNIYLSCSYSVIHFAALEVGASSPPQVSSAQW